jgi:hypothetical protein
MYPRMGCHMSSVQLILKGRWQSGMSLHSFISHASRIMVNLEWINRPNEKVVEGMSIMILTRHKFMKVFMVAQGFNDSVLWALASMMAFKSLSLEKGGPSAFTVHILSCMFNL